jgi:amino acid adenylation domain-containing protein/thioester reductase-like protein
MHRAGGVTGDTIVDRVDAVARGWPDRVAVTDGERSLTFAGVAEESAAIARALLDAGVGPGSLVALSLGRQPQIVSAMLGVLRAGGMYTVLEDQVDDGGLDCAIVCGASSALPAPGPSDVPLLRMEDMTPGADSPPLPTPKPNDPAYVLYTSGSSGRPKGVVVTHENIRAYVLGVLERLGIDRPMAYAHVSSLAADLGNTCLFLPLWTGGTIHLVDDERRRDPSALWRYLSTAGVEVLKITPSHWDAIRHVGRHGGAGNPKLEFLVFGGESLRGSLADQALRSGVARCVVNHYGPTEATIGVSAHLVRSSEDLRGLEGDLVPIGRPFTGVEVLIHQQDGSFTDRAGTGELYLGGKSIARGYLADEAATAASFVLIGEATRLYRTGDVVRRSEDGVLEFLGRTDRQLKVRGRRVEPEHIEAVARTCPGVQDAMVVPVDGGTGRTRLALAFVAPAGLTARHIDDHLGTRLPEYMKATQHYRFANAFPVNSNGKRDQRRVRDMIEAGIVEPCELPSAREPTDSRDQVRVSRIRGIWRRNLGDVAFDDDTDFFEAGGDSLDAIQVLSALMLLGYEVPSAVFLHDPTIRGLETFIAAPTKRESLDRSSDRDASAGGDEVRPSQRWFFAQGFADEDYWNQAILLAVRDPVVPALADAVEDVVQRHAALRTAFVRSGANGAVRGASITNYFSESTLPGGGQDAQDAHVHSVARQLHASIDIASGRTFVAHVFMDEGAGSGLVLLVAHHLGVDLASWRVLVADLSAAYGARCRSIRGDAPTQARTARRAPQQVERVVTISHESAPRVGQPPALSGRTLVSRGATGNSEASAASLWFALSDMETLALRRNVAGAGARLHYALLAAAVRTICTDTDADAALVDVETHGRSSDGEGLRAANVVGWFTVTVPVVVRSDADLLREARAVAEAVASRAADAEVAPSSPAAKLCYNFLGNVGSIADDEFALAARQGTIGPARGDTNARAYDLVLTARLVETQLVVELSFASVCEDTQRLHGTMERLRTALLALAGAEGSEGVVVLQSGSMSGLLAHAPASVVTPRADPRSAGYRKVLLTGATGHLGSYVLRDLLTGTDAEVVCLVRAPEDLEPKKRLQKSMARYFGEALMEAHRDRVTVVPGDVSAPQFGWSRHAYARLSREVEAIYHLAADTRLFGPPEGLRRVNTEGTARVVEFAETATSKDVHFASTLAVCGRASNPWPLQFSEHHLDIGQEFLSEYERSKFAAEQVLNEFAERGGACSVYRTGNISADSRSGLFRADAGDNRIVQFFRALVLVGGVPADHGRALALSPVDVVSAALVGLSWRKRRGVCHIDSPHVVTVSDVVEVLRDIGFAFRSCPHRTIGGLFADHAADHPDIALAHFWELRGDRNVVIDNSASDGLLARMGVVFPTIDRAWLESYFRGLVAEGALPAPRSFRPCVSEGELRREGVVT